MYEKSSHFLILLPSNIFTEFEADTASLVINDGFLLIQDHSAAIRHASVSIKYVACMLGAGFPRASAIWLKTS